MIYKSLNTPTLTGVEPCTSHVYLPEYCTERALKDQLMNGLTDQRSKGIYKYVSLYVNLIQRYPYRSQASALAVSLSLGNVPSQTRLESFIPHNEINDIFKINNVSINSGILPQGYTMPWARHVASPTCRIVKNPFTG